MPDVVVDGRDILKGFTLRIRMPRAWVWRRRVATLLIWLAAWVLGCGGVDFEVKEKGGPDGAD